MITLKVKPYCDNCPNFEPVADKYDRGAGFDMESKDYVSRHDTYVYCEHYLECVLASRIVLDKN